MNDESEGGKVSNVVQEENEGELVISTEQRKFSKLEGCQNGSACPTLTSQVCAHESTPTQSPPIQVMNQQGENSSPTHVMDQKGENVPYRIPSAVFARSDSTTPLDWSAASNDSLFSIQVGNQSFSEDHIVSENPGENFKSGELIALSPSVVAPGVGSNASVKTDECAKDKAGPSVDEPIPERSTHSSASSNPPTISNHSDDSETSGCTFFFPMRKKKRKKEKGKQQKKKCACFSNCNWVFCYCTWPSCCCSNFNWNCSIKRWCCNFSTVITDKRKVCVEEKKVVQKQQEEQPLESAVPSKSAPCSCSNCNWASCYCWNYSIKRWCCNFSTVFTDRRKVRGEEKKVVHKQQEEQSLASAAPSKSACCSCCTRFPLRRYCQWCCSCKCCRGN